MSEPDKQELLDAWENEINYLEKYVPEDARPTKVFTYTESGDLVQ